jgi:putative tryptophan/tyrosine transport system substrate-binding protein
MPVIGYLSSAGRNDRPKVDDACRRGVAETGLVEGQSVVIEYGYADGHCDRLPALAAELVARYVAVIAAVPFPSARAAKETTAEIPSLRDRRRPDPHRAGCERQSPRR